MGTTPTAATFNGTSTYAADLQQEITQAVTIASLPLNQLNSNLTSLQSQGTELATLQGDFAAIQTAIQSLDQASNGGEPGGFGVRQYRRHGNTRLLSRHFGRHL